MTVTIDYYMTLNSPWTYLGSALFAEIAGRNNVTINIKPCKFGPIFEQTGGLPLPKRSPQRRAYRMMELKRWREVRGIPINLEPRYSPCDDTAATRLVIAAVQCGSVKKRSPIPAPCPTPATACGHPCLAAWFHQPLSAPVSMPRSCAPAALPMPNSMHCMIGSHRRR
jgi:DSBA-like thioredoxin domain